MDMSPNASCQTMGVPIIQHQAVAFMLADMAIQTEASRALVWKAAWSKDAGQRNSKLPDPNYQ